MKRRRLLRHLVAHGCVIVRDTGPHTVLRNPANRRQTSVPRHREIKPSMAAEICKQVDVPPPPEK
jgi:mRNA interferase HicA